MSSCSPLTFEKFFCHSLGMDHDGTGNTCDNSHYVMSRDGGKGEDAFHWSPCSIDYLQQFLRLF